MFELANDQQMLVSGGVTDTVQLPLIAYTTLIGFSGLAGGFFFGHPIAGFVAGLAFCLGYENGGSDAVYKMKNGHLVVDMPATA